MSDRAAVGHEFRHKEQERVSENPKANDVPGS